MPTARYYVRASKGAGVHAIWKPLLGPFKRYSEANAMVPVVRRACHRHGIYNGCVFSVWKCTDERKPRGRLDLTLYVDQHWIDDVIKA